MTPSRSPLSHHAAIAALAAASLLGGGAAIAGAWAVGALDGSTTIVERTVAAASSPSRSGLTVQEVYERSAPAVVKITTTSSAPGGGLFGDGSSAPERRAEGSGFVIDRRGHIVTNFHVVEGADDIQVSFSSRDTVEARLVGSDPSTDLALLEVELPAGATRPLSLANSDNVRVGDPVVAIGNPFGLERTATAGIVSALQRTVTSPADSAIDHVIQTDAPINHGNSGGPLIDARGRVIGVNSQIETGGIADGNVGIGFAVPSNTVKKVVERLLADGKIERAFLGVAARSIEPELARSQSLPVAEGLLVETVTGSSGAAKAGIRGGDETVVVGGESYRVGGDIIVAVDGKHVRTIADLRDVVSSHEPGDTVRLELYRDGEKRTMRVTLGQLPASPAS